MVREIARGVFISGIGVLGNWILLSVTNLISRPPSREIYIFWTVTLAAGGIGGIRRYRVKAQRENTLRSRGVKGASNWDQGGS